jgi:Ni,Fe-hydrogenase III small subunit
VQRLRARVDATSSPYVDLQRFGLGIVASPRHADVLLVTGPVTRRMREPLLTAYAAMPEPRRVAALGDCALGCNVLGSPDEIVGPVDAVLPVDLRIPGCPPAPDEIAKALLELIDRGCHEVTGLHVRIAIVGAGAMGSVYAGPCSAAPTTSVGDRSVGGARCRDPRAWAACRGERRA